MFSFLNSAVLAAAAAALIPLIIHLFSRRRVKVMEFSSLRHLKEMQRRQVRRLQLRQWLLLALRMLIILVIVLAFARPTMQSGGLGSHAAVNAVILLDNSASMQRYVADGRLFDLARKRTEELLGTFGQSDQVLLMPLAGQGTHTVPSGFGSAAVALEQLAGINAEYGMADLQGGLETAVRLLAEAPSVNRELYLVSDRQRSSLPAEPMSHDQPIRVFAVGLPEEPNDNRRITAVDFGGQLIQPGGEFNLHATIRNDGAEPATELLVSLILDGRKVAQQALNIEPGGETRGRFSSSVSTAGYHTGYVEISDDKFLPDNRYYFSFRLPERFAVLVVNGDESAGYIALALTPNPALPTFWSVKQAAPEALGGMSFGEYDVVIMAGAPSLESHLMTRLQSFVERGGALLVTIGGQTRPERFNGDWSALTGLRIDEPVKQEFTRSGYYTLQTMDFRHPMFSVFDFDSTSLPNVKFFTLPRLTVSAQAKPLMTFTGGQPALVETGIGEGLVLSFTAPITPYYTDLPGHAFFVPLVSRMVEYLASDLTAFDTRLYVGQSFVRALALSHSPSGALQMITPDSFAFDIPLEEAQGGLTVRPAPVGLPGVYTVQDQGRDVDQFAVNIDPREADLTSVDPDQLAPALGASAITHLDPVDKLGPVIAQARHGRELWQLFLWIAATLVAVEMLLARGATERE